MSSTGNATSAAPIVVHRHGSVAMVRFARPEKRNALTTDLMTAMVDALEALDQDPEVRVAVITGGPKIFASGADVRELRDVSPVAYATSERVACWKRLNAVELPLAAPGAGIEI